ncbi:MAG: GNAT family N-acetyltransferase [Cryomorphaceae bacterium]|nr:GNAT family N-acetyltransferase [Cryomorphaceae bacterium]
MNVYKSERIYLRPLDVNDVTERYLGWLRDGDVKAFLEVDGNTLTLDDIREYIAEGPRTGSYFMYAICLNNTDIHIGNVKVGPINKKHLISDLPVVIGDKEFWGQGIAVEAIKLGNEIAFKEHGIRKLHGQIYRNNIGSIKAYCRGGWIVEGLIRGRYLVDGESMDQVIVSCNNPDFFPSEHDQYTIDHLIELQELRKASIS